MSSSTQPTFRFVSEEIKMINEAKIRGRPGSDAWECFTDEPFPMRLKRLQCKHCKKIIGFHKKVANVRTHLGRNCREFGLLMSGYPASERPDWYNDIQSNKRVKKQSLGKASVSPAFGPASFTTKQDKMQHFRKSTFPMLSVDDALSIVLQHSEQLEPVTLPLLDIQKGSCLAINAACPDPIPPFRASIMDGYALYSEDSSDEGCILEVVARITAGIDSEKIALERGQCAYITTGAMLPPNANAVIKIEDTEACLGDPSLTNNEEKAVKILKKVEEGKNIRQKGSDISMGQNILKSGDELTPSEIGLLATCGISRVTVFPMPIIGIMSTGNEIVEPVDESATNGKIRDSNRYALLSYVKSMGAQAVDLGIVPDSSGHLERSIAYAADRCDIIITTGGVSMGEADLLKTIIESLGKIHFGRVMMKPGKPTTFGTIRANGRNKLLFALPGNPASCLVTAHLFVTPAIKKLSGHVIENCAHSQVDVTIAQDLPLDPERPEYHRAIVSCESPEQGLVGRSTGNQMSCKLLSMGKANGLLCLPAMSGFLKAGSTVRCILIGEIKPPSNPLHSFHQKSAGFVFGDEFLSNEGLLNESVATCSGHHHHHSHDERAAGEHEHSHLKRTKIKVALLTISDRAHQGVYEDLSGPCIESLLLDQALSFDATVTLKSIVPDEPEEIKRLILEWSRKDVDLILTSGGTGFGRRDKTPEAIKSILEREAPGIALALLNKGLEHTPLAVLSRPVAGTVGNALIVTFPGSTKAIKENFVALVPLLPRIVNLLQGNAC